jgi:hypothetical protein
MYQRKKRRRRRRPVKKYSKKVNNAGIGLHHIGDGGLVHVRRNRRRVHKLRR